MAVATAAVSAAAMERAATKLRTVGLCKSYGDTVALSPIDLTICTGELLTLLGPSGSGKTTLLQLIAGLIAPTSGRLIIDGVDQTELEPYKRDIGVVFQNYSLFPHLTVSENIAFPLQMRKQRRADCAKLVGNVLEMVGLAGLARRFPHELSGGQQQRVALARCLVYRPSLILMDESLSALDRKLREAMQVELKRIHRETGSTIIFVTHDQEEALALSDRICLMNNGQIEQIGTPTDLYDRPRTVFAAGFIGTSNLIRGTVDAEGLLQGEMVQCPVDAAPGVTNGHKVAFALRPEYVRIGVPGKGIVDGEIIEQIYAGSETKTLVRIRSGEVFAAKQSSGFETHGLGQRVSVSWEARHLRLLES